MIYGRAIHSSALKIKYVCSNIFSRKMTKSVKIGTHNGTFHCDEVLACAMLKYAKPEYATAQIIRSRDMEVLKQCDIVVDVGGEYEPTRHRYDHHQRSFTHTMNSLDAAYPWTIKLSSAGLVYFHFGHEIIAQLLNKDKSSDVVKVIYNKVYENFIQEVDAIDNGIDMSDGHAMRYQIHTNLSSRVKRLNPAWNDPNADETARFEKAKELVGSEFVGIVHSYANIWWPARSIVESAIAKRKTVHPKGEIIVFENGGCPWKEHLFELEEALGIKNEIKFILHPDGNNYWRIQCVPVSPNTFENRLSLKEEWRGFRDEELSKISGIPDCIFVHMNGFIGGNKTQRGVYEMALRTLYPSEVSE